MADFKIAYAKTAVVEGGYANDKDDSGGETWKGIARNFHPNWSGWNIVDTLKKTAGFPANLERSEALQLQVHAFYKRNFWDVYNLDLMADQQVANELYDTGVNCGTETVAKYFQRILNVLNLGGKHFADLKVDGQVGRASLEAFHKLPANDRRLVWKLLN